MASTDQALLNLIADQLKNAQRILVTTHVHPDGDAIGSLLGIGLALQVLGKEVQMVLDDGIPSNLKFLPGSDQVAGFCFASVGTGAKAVDKHAARKPQKSHLSRPHVKYSNV